MTAIIQKTIPLGEIYESPTNPRKHFDKEQLEELAASIKQKGVLQPVLVRPRGRNGQAEVVDYELVAGARRFRSSKLAGLSEIPAVIRELSDAEVIEAQVIENNQRADVHPLEEADGFAALARDHRYTAETIAAKIGRSTSYVYQRLKLSELSPSARKFCLSGKLSLAGALVLARLPSAEVQELALADIMRRSHGDEPFELWTVKNVVQNNYTLRLADAHFDRTDAEILPSAGACTTCPKRTGAQAEMFAAFDPDDRCTDVHCFNTKKEASWSIRAAAARKKGLAVIEGDEAKRLFMWGGQVRHDAEFINLNEPIADDDTGEEKTWRERIGKNALKVTLARHESGQVYELVRKDEALEHVKNAAGRDLVALGELTRLVEQEEPDRKRDEEEEATHRQERAIEDATIAATTSAIASAVEKKGIKGKALWLAFLVAVDDFANEERIAARRGLPTEGLSGPHHRKDSDSFVQRIAVSMSENQVAALVVEILSDTYDTRARDAFAAALDIDQEAIGKEAAAQVLGKGKAKKKAVRHG